MVNLFISSLFNNAVELIYVQSSENHSEIFEVENISPIVTFENAEIFGDVMGLAEGLQLGFKSAGENLMKGKGLSAIKKMGMTVGQGAVGGAFNTLGHVTNAAGNTVKKITNFTDINLVKIYNFDNELESTIEVGLFPGDFAYWEEQQ